MMDTPSPCATNIAATIGVIHLVERTILHASERIVLDRNPAAKALDPATHRIHR